MQKTKLALLALACSLMTSAMAAGAPEAAGYPHEPDIGVALMRDGQQLVAGSWRYFGVLGKPTPYTFKSTTSVPLVTACDIDPATGKGLLKTDPLEYGLQFVIEPKRALGNGYAVQIALDDGVLKAIRTTEKGACKVQEADIERVSFNTGATLRYGETVDVPLEWNSKKYVVRFAVGKPGPLPK